MNYLHNLVPSFCSHRLTDIRKNINSPLDYHIQKDLYLNEVAFENLLLLGRSFGFSYFIINHASTLLIKYLQNYDHIICESLDLVIMCSIIISVKTMSQTQVNKVLKEAYNRFGREEITNLELKILKRLEFDILLLDETLFDHTTMLLSCLRFYLPENNEWTLFKILEDVISLLYQKTASFSEFQNLTQLAAGCIQGSVALACQVNTKFPLTTRLSKIINLDETQVIELSQKVLKLLLPHQIVEGLIL